MQRTAFIYRSSPDNRRHICIDKTNSSVIFSFLKEDKARRKKFLHIIDLLLQGKIISDLYSSEQINKATKDVTAMKLFKGGQNIRIYCKEVTTKDGTFYVVVSELLPKKKTQKITGIVKNLINTVEVMSMKSSQQGNNIHDWEDLLKFESAEEEISHEAQILMFSFLSEIQKYQTIQGITRKELAAEIGKSPSYLTQLFRGSKPLNFDTIARIKKVLGIEFNIIAKAAGDTMIVDEDVFIDVACRYQPTSQINNGTWYWKKFDHKDNKYEENKEELLKTINDDNQALTA